jgi:hypothetical protein
MLHRSATLAGREVIDEAGYLIVHYQRQIGTRLAHLCLRFSPHRRVDRKSDLVSLVDRCRLAALLGKPIALLQGQHLQPVYAFDNPVEFAFQTIIGVNANRTG